VVVFAGVTLAEPESARAVALTLGLMLTEVALVLLQVRTTDWPAVIWLAAAVMCAVGFAGGSTVPADDPPHAVSTKTSNVIASALTIGARGRMLGIS
jgi:hypothetical protein